MIPRKYRLHAVLMLAALVIIYTSYTNNQPDKNQVQAADTAAQEFLQMVDAGRYDDSWLIIAPYLQGKIARADWPQKLTELRSKVGKLQQRSLDSASFTAAIKEMPDSTLMLLEYDSVFAAGQQQEVITMIQGSDNRWKVVGYFIK